LITIPPCATIRLHRILKPNSIFFHISCTALINGGHMSAFLIASSLLLACSTI
jgi:hypothetical protein